MDNSSAEARMGLPLFMFQHTTIENSCTIPREGVDFFYNDLMQKAEWTNPDATNKWSPTAYSDTKVDGVDFVAINYFVEH
jgi:hypothetical protein